MTRKGKGTKIMLLIEGRRGLPVAFITAPANNAESALLEATLAARKTRKPVRIIADRAYDSKGLFTRLKGRSIQLIAPHRRGRTAAPTQDGRCLRRYKNRWLVERTNAWLLNFRRIAMRHDRDLVRYQGFLTLACALICLRGL
jgi:transposase